MLQDALDAHKKVIEAKIRRDGKVDYGTTAWYKVDGTSNMAAYGTEDPIVVQLDNKYIFSQNFLPTIVSFSLPEYIFTAATAY